MQDEPNSKLAPRIASAAAATLVAAVFFGLFGKGVVEWNSPLYWAFLGLVFAVAMLAHGKVD